MLICLILSGACISASYQSESPNELKKKSGDLEEYCSQAASSPTSKFTKWNRPQLDGTKNNKTKKKKKQKKKVKKPLKSTLAAPGYVPEFAGFGHEKAVLQAKQ